MLLVEGCADGLSDYYLILGRSGASTTRASSVPAALSTLEKQQPDVLIAELAAGEDLVPAVWKAVGHWIPAICASAKVDARDYDRALSCGFQLILPKPVDPEILVTVIRRLKARGRHPDS